MIQVRTEIEIEVPSEHVWTILIDFGRYSEWNPFIREIEGELSVGQKLSVALGNPSKGQEAGLRFHPKVTVVEEGRSFHWLGTTLVRGLMDGEHIFEVQPVDAHRSRFFHGEDYGGLLVHLFGRFVPDDGAPNYIAMNEALKHHAEATWNE